MTRVTKSARLRKVNKPEPVTLSERVRASEDRKIANGGRRMPGGVMPADAAAALEYLQGAQYAPSAGGCIYRALVEAGDRMAAEDDKFHGRKK